VKIRLADGSMRMPLDLSEHREFLSDIIQSSIIIERLQFLIPMRVYAFPSVNYKSLLYEVRHMVPSSEEWESLLLFR
jgi:hypothetical protein